MLYLCWAIAGSGSSSWRNMFYICDYVSQLWPRYIRGMTILNVGNVSTVLDTNIGKCGAPIFVRYNIQILTNQKPRLKWMLLIASWEKCSCLKEIWNSFIYPYLKLSTLTLFKPKTADMDRFTPSFIQEELVAMKVAQQMSHTIIDIWYKIISCSCNSNIWLISNP